MAIKFLLSADDDLIWDIDDHSEPLTEQQAKLVAFRQMGTSLGAIADALEKIASRMEARSAAAAKPQKAKPKPKAAAKRKGRR
jgi:short subunit dehydrogenase-like uncharacterized protein